MKNKYTTSLLIAITIIVATGQVLKAQSKKDHWRYHHVVKGLKMSKQLESKFSPAFYAYLKEWHAARDIYNDLKDKYRAQIDKRQLTPAQAQELLDNHWKSEEEEIKVKRKYTQVFSQIVKKPYVYYIFQLANDKVPKNL